MTMYSILDDTVRIWSVHFVWVTYKTNTHFTVSIGYPNSLTSESQNLENWPELLITRF